MKNNILIDDKVASRLEKKKSKKHIVHVGDRRSLGKFILPNPPILKCLLRKVLFFKTLFAIILLLP